MKLNTNDIFKQSVEFYNSLTPKQQKYLDEKPEKLSNKKLAQAIRLQGMVDEAPSHARTLYAAADRLEECK